MLYKIYPPVGIARIGDSSDEWFIGPEIPGRSERPAGGYKSLDCRIKRQGARFRIFAFHDDGAPVLENDHPKEITADDAVITWKVTLANTKASSERFRQTKEKTIRNPDVVDRESLNIRTEGELGGVNAELVLPPGKFRGAEVSLGQLRVDDKGRLIVLGGAGLSRKILADGSQAKEDDPGYDPGLNSDMYDVNDWHDDVSDGPVRATISIGGQTLDATPAWVVVAPPSFAPATQPSVTLYDRLRQKFVDAGLLAAPAQPYSFRRDIRPILKRGTDIAGVFPVNTNGPADEGPHQTLRNALIDPLSLAKGYILQRVAPPNTSTPLAAGQMPKLKDDDKILSVPLTSIQYAALKAWAENEPGAVWVDDWTGSPDTTSASPTPDGLTEAALEACVGRGMRPGIEAGHFIVETATFVEPFRLDPDATKPGDITARMAVPWQNDFFHCSQEGAWGWWPTHRPDSVYLSNGDHREWLTGGGGMPSLVSNLRQFGFVVRKDGKLVEVDRSVVCRGVSVIAKRDTISRAQVDAALDKPPPGKSPGCIPNAIELRVGGSSSHEVGADKTPPSKPDLKLLRADGTSIPGLSWEISAPATQTADPDIPQVLTYMVDLLFADTSAFTSGGVSIENQILTVAVGMAWDTGDTSGVATGDGQIGLTNAEAPRIEDGPVPWLSQDLRVFRVTVGQSPIVGPAPKGNGADAALDYITTLLSQFNAAPREDHPFDTLPVDGPQSALELYASKADEPATFNFAVTRVRYDGKSIPAQDVRVFFRLFTTAATGFDFDINKAYRRTGDIDAPAPLLGFDGGGSIITMPFFAEARVDSSTQSLATQTDSANVRTIKPAPSGETEAWAYFGCWLDINQPTPQFPESPWPKDGPWSSTVVDPNGGRKPIQALMNGEHQCLVAEIAFADREIPVGANPAGDGRLAQRNLVWVASDNPGGPETRTIQHSFMVKRSAGGRGDDASREELVIRKDGLPPDSRVRIYLPDISAIDVIHLAERTMDYPGIFRVDAHTVECTPGDVSFIPIPSDRDQDAPALISIELPEGIRKGQSFQCQVEQLSAQKRVRGAFQLNIPIGSAREMRQPEMRRLSLLRSLLEAKSTDSPWRAVLVRYVDQAAARVRGYGGDPDAVAASPSGDWGAPATPIKAMICRLLAVLFTAACAVVMIAFGLHPAVTFVVKAASASAVLLLAFAWLTLCKPSLRWFALALGTGLMIGTAGLGAVHLLGLGGPHMANWLAVGSLCGVAVLLLGLLLPKLKP